MKTFDYVITDSIGIHARPAGMLVKEVKELNASVTVACKGKQADARKLMALMSLGIRHGDTVTVTIEGEEEAEAEKRMKNFFEQNL